MNDPLARMREKTRRSRIERGLPPDPPERSYFVDEELTRELVERIKPFYAIAVRYASLLSQGQVVRVDTGKIAEYKRLASLLRRSTNYWCRGIGGVIISFIDMIGRFNEGDPDTLDIPHKTRILNLMLKFMDTKPARLSADYKPVEPDRYQQLFDDAWAEMQRLDAEEGE
ncbi:hypothetical protein ACF3MZ_15200 [Paenibacillaceae bacterium WGS1546]|uniref:hypothetical protein n=1 Tax=Cohnella sp. WGS1546 TaxID=3366810 RepID=UPI00372CEE43